MTWGPAASLGPGTTNDVRLKDRIGCGSCKHKPQTSGIKATQMCDSSLTEVTLGSVQLPQDREEQSCL